MLKSLSGWNFIEVIWTWRWLVVQLANQLGGGPFGQDKVKSGWRNLEKRFRNLNSSRISLLSSIEFPIMVFTKKKWPTVLGTPTFFRLLNSTWVSLESLWPKLSPHFTHIKTTKNQNFMSNFVNQKKNNSLKLINYGLNQDFIDPEKFEFEPSIKLQNDLSGLKFE